MNFPHSFLIIVVMLYCHSLHAEESEEKIELSLEFLEFLGEWETDEGEWIDPVELDDDSYAVLTNESGEINNE